MPGYDDLFGLASPVDEEETEEEQAAIEPVVEVSGYDDLFGVTEQSATVAEAEPVTQLPAEEEEPYQPSIWSRGRGSAGGYDPTRTETAQDAAQYAVDRGQVLTAGVEESMAGVVETAAKPLDMYFGAGWTDKKMKEDPKLVLANPMLVGTAESLRMRADERTVEAYERLQEMGPVGRFTTELIDSALFMAPSIATSYVTKKGDLGLSVMGAMVYGRTLSEQLGEGAEYKDAVREALIQTAFEIGPEKAFGFYDNIPLTAGAKQWLKQSLVESLSEMTTEELNIRYEAHNGDMEGVADWGRRFKAGAAGFFMGAGLTVPSAFKTADPNAPADTWMPGRMGPKEAQPEADIPQADAAIPPIPEVSDPATYVENAKAQLEQATAEVQPVEEEEVAPETEAPIEPVEPIDEVTPVQEPVVAGPAPDINDPDTWQDFPEGAPSVDETTSWHSEASTEAADQAWTDTAADRASLSQAVQRDLENIRAERGAASRDPGISLQRAKVLARSKILKDKDGNPMVDYADYTAPEGAQEWRQEEMDQEFRETVSEMLAQKYIFNDKITGLQNQYMIEKARAAQEQYPRLEINENHDPNYGPVSIQTKMRPQQEEPVPAEQAPVEASSAVEQEQPQDTGPPPEFAGAVERGNLTWNNGELTLPNGEHATAENASVLMIRANQQRAKLTAEIKELRAAATPDQEKIQALEAERDGLQEFVDDLSNLPSEPEPLPESAATIALNIADVTKRREERGLDPVPLEAQQSDQRTLELAQQMLNENPRLPAELASSVLTGEKPTLTSTELVVLLTGQMDIENRKADAIERSADETATQGVRDAARDEWQALELELNRLEIAATMVGTETGRALRIRRLLMKKDFSLASMERTLRADLGRPLTESERKKIEGIANDLKAAQKELEETRTELEQERKTNEAHAIIQRMAKLGTESKVKNRKWLDSLEKKAQESRDWLAANRFTVNAPIYQIPVGVYHLGRIGATHIARGAVEFKDWVAAMQADLGKVWDNYKDDAEEIFGVAQEEFEADRPASRDQRAEGVKSAEAEAKNGDEVPSHKAVYKIAKGHVASGMRGEREVMQATHQDLLKSFPDITEREVRRIFVEYGQFKDPVKDQVKEELNLITKLVKLQEDIDRLENQEKLPRRESKKEEMRKELLNKKRKRDFLLQQAERYDPELRQERYRTVNEAREQRLKQQIAELTVQIETGMAAEPREVMPETTNVEDLKARRDGLKKELQAMKDKINPPPTEEELWNDRLSNRLERRRRELRTKLREKDFGQKPVPVRHKLTKRNQELQSTVQALQHAFLTDRYKAQMKQLKGWKKAGTWLVRGVALQRGIQASTDLSALGRQGFPALAVFPKKSGIPTIKAAFSTLFSQQRADAINDAILADPIIAEARQHGLHITDPYAADASKLEEEFMDNLFRRLPVIKSVIYPSARSYITSLNVARATTYKAFADSMFDGKPSPEEARQIVNLINNATGRGAQTKEAPGEAKSIAKVEQLLNGASAVFYAPRFLLSRFLFPLHMLRGINPGYVLKSEEGKRIQRAQLKMGASTVGFMFAMKTLMTLAALGLADDGDEISWNFNPTSTDFMRVRIENDDGVFRLDPTLGMGAGIVLASRIILGFKTDGKGKMSPIRKPLNPFWNPYEAWSGREWRKEDVSMDDLFGDFLEYKLSPFVGLINMLVFGRDVMDEEVTPAGAVAKSTVPLIFQDFEDINSVIDEPALMGTLGIAAIFGWPGSGVTPDTDEFGIPKLRPLITPIRDDEKLRIDF